MADTLSSSLPKVDLPRVEPPLAVRPGPAAATQAASPAEQAEAAKTQAAVGEHQPADETRQPRPEKSLPSDIRLKYQVDEKTKDVTLLVLDRASHEVIRAIPPEAMTKMDPGELLELFA
jgi:uncharacterized FlaG/YvyC family protein